MRKLKRLHEKQNSELDGKLREAWNHGGPHAASENSPNHSGRPKKRTAELVERVREYRQQIPKRFARKRSQFYVCPVRLARE